MKSLHPMPITRSILPLMVCLLATAPTYATDSVTYSEWARQNTPLDSQLAESQQAPSAPALETDSAIDEPGGPGDGAVPNEATPPEALENTDRESMLKDHQSAAPLTAPAVAVKGGPSAFLHNLKAVFARTTTTLEEAWVTTKIRSELTLKQGIDSGRIKVETDDGTVTLAGRVLDECQREQALLIAGDTRGVKQILDLIQVHDSAPIQTL